MNKGNYLDNSVYQCQNEAVGAAEIKGIEGSLGRRDCLIKNKCAIELNLCGRKHVFESNEVEANKVRLIVRKYESCQAACEGDCIEYTVVIKNDSCVSVCNCEFIDILERDLVYESNSFKVNGKKENPTIVGKGIYYIIPEIKANCEAVVVFDAKVC